ncbi:MAG TPA: hypothetical protein VKT22_14885 [Steroidobacteraceae bacterium]|nr:hypothetical protein [Steroidobacteraceae bacterium]
MPSDTRPASLNAATPAAVLPGPHRRSTSAVHRPRVALAGLSLALLASGACAFTATLSPAAPLTVYLQVGVGSFTNDYIYGGQPENNATVNTVSVALAATAVGNGTAQTMTTNSTASMSYWDGFAYCNLPNQLYIGGFYRTTGGKATTAQVTAQVPAALTDSAGHSLPFSTISWSSSGNLDTGAEPFPAGTFAAGGAQSVGSMASNTWNESCWTFAYANKTVPAAGTFTGVVLYTLSAP